MTIQNVIEAAFSEDVLERRQNSPLVTVGDDRAMVLRVTDHKPAEPRPLADVRAQIEAQLNDAGGARCGRQQRRGSDCALAEGRSVVRRSRALRVSLPVGKRFVTRQDTSRRRAVSAAAFGAPRGRDHRSEAAITAGVTTDDGNYAVFAVTQVRSGDAAHGARRPSRRRVSAGRSARSATKSSPAISRKPSATRRSCKNEKVFE